MMRGDLLLYTSSGKWYERLITLATHGPFVHVGIILDASTVIAARTGGIAYEKAPPEDAMHVAISLAPYTTPAGIEQGLAWATRQVGRHYGWSDIVYQGIKFLWPNNTLRFGIEGHWDCADFATRYLQHAGVSLPDAYSDPYCNTPNDLARAFGLLAETSS
jgi:hypothetical protein